MTEVYKAISAVTGELAKIGIAKEQKNAQQGYKFRGIDDVYNALAPLLARHQLCLLPRVKSRTVTEKVTPKGTTLFYVVLDVDYDLVSAVDGSSHTVSVAGEAMDSGDKATNKAMSAAYKYMCLQAFTIPTQGDNDADATTHEVVAPPEIPDDVKLMLEEASAEGMPALKDAWKELSADARRLITDHHLTWWEGVKGAAS